MAKTMTASGITDGQIENAVGKLRDALRTHREEISSEAAQMALGVPNIGMVMFAPFREQASKLIVRHVKVNRTRTPKEAISATGRVEYLDNAVVAAMLRGTTEEVDVCFFPLEKFTSAKDVQKALADHGLESDPIAIAAANEDDPTFADSHPNGTQWVDKDGNHCYLAFGRGDGRRRVDCCCIEHVWRAYWWVGGVRKQSSST